MTKIHWTHWDAGTGDDIDFMHLKELVDLGRKYPDAVLFTAFDSEGSSYLVLASGDISDPAITRELDRLFDN
jgi:hypothetical protein